VSNYNGAESSTSSFSFRPPQADLPTDPRTSAFLLAALASGCAEHAITIAAMTSITGGQGGGIFVGWRAGAGRTVAQASDAAARQFAVKEGDHLTLLNVYRAFEIAGRSREWCVAHCVSHSSMMRATEVRSQLRGSLSALITRERVRRQSAKTVVSAASSAGSRRLPVAVVDYEDDEESNDVLVFRTAGRKRSRSTTMGFDSTGSIASDVVDPSIKWSLSGDATLDDDDGAMLLLALRRCLVSGFFSNAARLGYDGKYVTVKEGQSAAIHSSSVLSRMGGMPAEWVIYGSAVWSAGELQMHNVTVIDPRWLLELAPHYYEARGGYKDAGPSDSSTVSETGRVGADGVAAAPPAALPLNIAYKSAAQRKRERDEQAALEHQAAEARKSTKLSQAASTLPVPPVPPPRAAGVAGVLGLLFGDEAADGAFGTAPSRV
jgi:HrpA-like RNA helicase